jgi:uncharacterized protein (TIGR02246 family)
MTDDEAAIRQVVETWMVASRKGDLETVLALMTDDVVFMVPGRSRSASKPSPPPSKAWARQRSTA